MNNQKTAETIRLFISCFPSGKHSSTGKNIHKCWPRMLHHSYQDGMDWASSNGRFNRNKEGKIPPTSLEVKNEFDIILDSDYDYRGNYYNAKIPQGLIYCEEHDIFLLFDFRVDALMETLNQSEVVNGKIKEKMGFRYKGANYYPVPLKSDTFKEWAASVVPAPVQKQKYTTKYSKFQKVASKTFDAIYIGKILVEYQNYRDDIYRWPDAQPYNKIDIVKLYKGTDVQEMHGYLSDNGDGTYFPYFYRNKIAMLEVSDIPKNTMEYIERSIFANSLGWYGERVVPYKSNYFYGDRVFMVDARNSKAIVKRFYNISDDALRAWLEKECCD